MTSRRPTTRSITAIKPVVKTATGTPSQWNWQIDDRLYCDSVTRRSGIEGGSCTISVRLDSDFTIKDAIEKYCRIDKYVLVETPDAQIADCTLLFMGRIVNPRTGITTDQNKTVEEIKLPCIHLCQELDSEIVRDRWVRKADGNDAVLVPMVPVFNFGGFGNRTGWNVSLDHAGTEYDVPAFSRIRDGYDDDAVFWNYAGAFVYTIGNYCSPSRRVFVDFREFLSICEDLVDEGPGDSGLAYFLGHQSVEINLDGLGAREAIDRIAQACGIEYAYRCAYINSKPMIVFDAWCPGSGTKKNVQLANPVDILEDGWPTKTAAETLAANNINQLRNEYDSRHVITAVRVTGLPNRVESTFELVPGWPKNSVTDNVSDKEQAKKDALAHVYMDNEDLKNNNWFTTYCSNSPVMPHGVDYGRLWVLNEDGAYTSSPYNRTEFDVAGSLGGDEDSTAKRPRQFLPCLSYDAQGKSYAVYTEVSYDAGAKWYPLSGVRILPDRCGIYVTANDLVRLTPPGVEDPSENNFWFALIDGSLKIRVTACIDLDERLTVEETISGVTQRWREIRDPNLRVWKRMNSQLSSVDADTHDDTEAAVKLAESILNINSQYQIPSELTIPWFETEYVLGDRIAKIEGREIPLSMTLGEVESSPVIVGINWIFGDTYATKLILQDDRLDSDKGYM